MKNLADLYNIYSDVQINYQSIFEKERAVLVPTGIYPIFSCPKTTSYNVMGKIF